MKKLLFFSAMIFGFAISSEAQTFQNNTNCDISLSEQCYDPITCTPFGPATVVAVAPPSTTVAYSSTCIPGQVPVFVIEYTTCPGVRSAEFTSSAICGFGAASHINLGRTECPGCDEADVVDQPGGGVKVGN